MEGRKERRKRERGEQSEPRLIISLVFFLSLSFNWYPNLFPSQSYLLILPTMLLPRPPRWDSHSRTEPADTWILTRGTRNISGSLGKRGIGRG